MWVQKGQGEPEFLKAGDIVEVGEEAVLLEAPGHVGLMLFPPSTDAQEIEVGLKSITNWSGKSMELFANFAVTEMLGEVHEVEILLGQRRGEEALYRVQELRSKYPRVSYLAFLEASCLVVLGDFETARGLLERALAEYPNNQEAQALYRSIAGE